MACLQYFEALRLYEDENDGSPLDVESREKESYLDAAVDM